MDYRPLAKEIRLRLEALYGSRLKGLLLYGSVARGTETDDSDVDVLVLLEGPLDYGRELKAQIDALYPLTLEWGRPMSPEPTVMSDYEAAEFPLYRSVHREGVAI